MVKNVKIDEDTHRALSMEAAARAVQKGVLCAALINAALQELGKETVDKYLITVTSPDNS